MIKNPLPISVQILKKEINRLQRILQESQSIMGINRPLENKYFCIGSNKTGTTSLNSAMMILGYRSIPEELSYSYINGFDPEEWANQIKQLLEKESSNYNFFQDLPFCYGDFYKIIHKVYPNAKYILTIREEDAWFDSCLRWIEKMNCAWTYNKIWNIDFNTKNKEKIIQLYMKRNEEIQQYFKPEQILVFDIATATYSELCKFLNIDARLPIATNNLWPNVIFRYLLGSKKMPIDLAFPRDNVNDL